ncbi:MAG TPA: restriction endonuclease subunit R, partial [Bacteroidia bacterium]|nr:restriction endonuclease subunit R [Bacteroidia bacterium]
KLDSAREALRHLCEPVPPPQGHEQFLLYFCGSAADEDGLTVTEPLRISFYKATAAFLRAYADISSHLIEAGYGLEEAGRIREETEFYAEIRAAIKKHAGEELDIKAYEADMRHLINTYVQADHAEPLGTLEGLTLTELIVESGINDAIAKKLNARGNLSNNAVAEGIINNLRKTIIRDQLADPRFYEQMSKLLQDLIQMSRKESKDYEAFLERAEELARQLVKKSGGDFPAPLHGNVEATVLFRNLPDLSGDLFHCPEDVEERALLAMKIDHAMREEAPAGWKGDQTKESIVKNFLHKLMNKDKVATPALFEIVKNQPGY